MHTESEELNSNLCQLFLEQARLNGNQPALYYKDKQKKYQSLSWESWKANIRLTSSFLQREGIKPRDRIAILSENRPEWTFADFGTLALGAITVPLYPTASCHDFTYILNNAGVEVLFISTAEQWARVSGALAETRVRLVISFDTIPETAGGKLRVVTLDSILKGKEEIDEKAGDSLFEKLISKVDCNEVATLIYTSGTTGPPKGVMLTHRNFVANYLGAKKVIPIRTSDVALSFLPLSHVFERLAGYYFVIFQGARIAYAENMQTVPQDLLQVRPTVAASVPRLYEKIYARIMETVNHSSRLKRLIFGWAIHVAHQRKYRQAHPSVLYSINYALADLIVYRKLKKNLGGNIRFFISGGAPLAKELAEFFYGAGILILEGYGLTETSPVIAVNSETNFKFGTVGKPLPNIQVRIAEDGEILTAGPCVMKGYYGKEEETREVIRDGWFYTGDIGVIDEEGYLKITDRKKDIIVTSGGKNISPQNIENMIISDPLFLQAIVIGDKRNYLVALLVPNRQEILSLAKDLDLQGKSWSELLKDPKIKESVDQRLRKLTSGLSRYEQIKYFALLEEELTQERGELTPTMKIKRKVVAAKYENVIQELYARGEELKKTGD